jgi:hypothetical protein
VDETRELVFETGDRPQAELLVGALVSEGVDAWLEGVRDPALLGASAFIFSLRVYVPASQVERARQLVELFLAPAGPEDVGDQTAAHAPAGPQAAAPSSGDATATGPAPPDGEELSPLASDEPSTPGGRRLRPIVAAGCTFIVPGGCHFYVRRQWTGFVLVLAWVIALRALMRGDGRAALIASAILPLLTVDLLGGLWALRAERRGRFASAGGQIVRGVLLVALAFGASLGTVAWEAHRRAARLAYLTDLSVACTRDSLRIRNRGSKAQTLQISAPTRRIEHVLFSQEETLQLNFSSGASSSRVNLPAGANAELTFTPPDPEHCASHGMSIALCELTFQVFSVSSPDGVWGDMACAYPSDMPESEPASFTRFSSE